MTAAPMPMIQAREDRFDCLDGSHVSLAIPGAPSFEIECAAAGSDAVAPKPAPLRDLAASVAKTNLTDSLTTEDELSSGGMREAAAPESHSPRSVADDGAAPPTAKPPARRARLAKRMSSDLRASSRDLAASFTNLGAAGGEGEDDDASARRAARLVAGECGLAAPPPRLPVLDPDEALALEVGLSAVAHCWSPVPNARPTIPAVKSLLSALTSANAGARRKPLMKTLRSSMTRRRPSACWYNKETRPADEGRAVGC